VTHLKLTDVSKAYSKDLTVLQDIDLEIAQGELVVFVGPSGCGKSTLLRMIAGLEQITGGTLSPRNPRPKLSRQSTKLLVSCSWSPTLIDCPRPCRAGSDSESL